MDETSREDYGRDYVEAWQKFFKGAMDMCYSDPSPVIDAMVDAVISKQPKHRYLVGGLWFTYFEAYCNRLLPSWFTDTWEIAIADHVATPKALMKSKSSWWKTYVFVCFPLLGNATGHKVRVPKQTYHILPMFLNLLCKISFHIHIDPTIWTYQCVTTATKLFLVLLSF